MQVHQGRPVKYLQIIWCHTPGILSAHMGGGKHTNSRLISTKESNDYKKRTQSNRYKKAVLYAAAFYDGAWH